MSPSSRISGILPRVTQTDGVILDVSGLRVGFDSMPDRLAVDGVSFSVRRGSTVALVGASGSGKSVTALALTRLIPVPPCRYLGGRVLFGGTDLMSADERALRNIRGSRIAYVFQEPSVALNPVLRVGPQIAEVVRLHRPGVDPAREVSTQLERVGLPEPHRVASAYPHELSGGMQQRVVLAMALAGRPELLVADEPTTALDVTIQAQILDLLRDLRETLNLTVLLITHNLGLVADIADEVHVMQDGHIVESGSAASLLRSPSHPYTMALRAAVPALPEQMA
jgi:ABC-type dipeptide/oligopeptide/nickel transport system ATPase component